MTRPPAEEIVTEGCIGSEAKSNMSQSNANSNENENKNSIDNPVHHHNSSNNADKSNVYESDESLHMYLGLHFPSSFTNANIPPILPHQHAPIHGLSFPQRVSNLLVTLLSQQQQQQGPMTTTSSNHRALDIGCAVGGTSFELAKIFDHVDAFDSSASFIRMAQRMQHHPEQVTFRIHIEGDIYQEVPAIHSPGMTSNIRSKVHFFTGDACRIEQSIHDGFVTSYDGIIMSNLLCRLPDPMACLKLLPDITNPGGIIVMANPFSWLTEYTAHQQWLGGFYDSKTNEPIHTHQVLQQLMEQNGFEKIYEEDIPLIIREHQRKYQYIISSATGWRKVVVK